MKLTAFLLQFTGVMVNVCPSSAVDREFEPRSGQIKDNEIGMLSCVTKHAALRPRRKDWLALNQDNVA